MLFFALALSFLFEGPFPSAKIPLLQKARIGSSGFRESGLRLMTAPSGETFGGGAGGVRGWGGWVRGRD